MTQKVINAIKRNIFIVLLITLFLCISQSNAPSNFVTVNPTKGITVDLPRNWSVMSDNQRITLDTWKESVLEAHRLSDIENGLPFAANYYDDRGETAGTFAIRIYPSIVVTQSEAATADSLFIKELDEGVRENFTKGYEASGGQMVAWLGTTKKSINDSVYFISESRQLSPLGAGIRGILVRYLNAEKSFTIIITYREDQEYFLRPICDKIISSIHS